MHKYALPYKLATLIYPVRDEHVLLLRRNKPPFPGFWIAPGGKVEQGESPHEGALRELQEETGLTANRAELRAIVTETSNRDDWQWLIFVYRVIDPIGDVKSDEREGVLRWFQLGVELKDAKIPDADKVFMPAALNSKSAVIEYRFNYDDELNLIDDRPAHRYVSSSV